MAVLSFYCGGKPLDGHLTITRRFIQVFCTMKSFPLAIVVCILVVSAALAVFWTSSRMEAEVSRRVGSSLETVLNSTHESLRTWQERITVNVSFIANSTEIHAQVENQIRLPHNRLDR